MKMFLHSFIFSLVVSCYADSIKEEFCRNLFCYNETQKAVCGIREEGEGYRLRLFESECELLKFGCNVGENETYGIINFEYCERTFFNDSKICNITETQNPDEKGAVCGIREDGDGFRVRLFENEHQLLMYNCRSDTNFTITDLYICNGVDMTKNEAIDEAKDGSHKEANDKAIEDNNNEIINEPNDDVIDVAKDKAIDESKGEAVEEAKFKAIDDPQNLDEDKISEAYIDKMSSTSFNDNGKVMKPVVVVDVSMFKTKDINATVDNFFDATHLQDIPLDDIQKDMNDSTRRRLIHIFGPQVVFKPKLKIPENFSEDYYHQPTLSSCFHRCPEKCPDMYAPVCGRPGNIGREPSLMFQNHCFMDVAQCKVRWENKSPTAISSRYMEMSFVFCLGSTFSSLYKFLPLIRTLQHMGRLKKKGNFKHRLRNLRYMNDFLARDVKLMG